MPSTATPDPVRAYAEAVVAGQVVAGPWVRLACRRHLDDLAAGHERGLRFDAGAAQDALDFFRELLCLPDGRPFVLQPWQQFIVGSLVGWYGADGTRRYRTAYVEVGKGNGKTPLAAGLALYALVVDAAAAPAAEVYSAATTREQAAIAFRDARLMAEASPALARRLTIAEHSLTNERVESFMRAVSSEHRGLDGKRVQMAIIDELHEHPNGLVVQKMRAGTKGRQNALIVEITNAGYDRESVCWAHHEHSIAVLEGRADNDGWFAYVAALDEADVWTDEAVWPKANPNLGVSIQPAYLREQVRDATNLPAAENLVRRLNFCQWTEQETRWLDLALWDACAGPVAWPDMAAHCRGRRCVGGLDLANTSDLAALVLLFADHAGDDVVYDVLPVVWCPAEAVKDRSRASGVPYAVWVRDGALVATEGDVIDYRAILATLAAATEAYTLVDLGYDRWGSTKLVQDLIELGFDGTGRARDRRLTPLGQGYATLSAPTKELEVLVKRGQLRHGGHPVLRWAISNLVVTQDPAGNIKPDKAKASEKIDPAVALINALARATEDTGQVMSVYNDKPLLILG